MSTTDFLLTIIIGQLFILTMITGAIFWVLKDWVVDTIVKMKLRKWRGL
jgi:hypothetical protein